MKIAVNHCYGGFDLSYQAVMRYAERKGMTLYAYTYVNRWPSRDMVLIPYTGQEALFVCYTTRPLAPDEQPNSDIFFSTYEITRDDPDLIAVIEELGEAASGAYSKVEIVEIPDEIEWVIAEYDGMEHVEEAHRSWG